METIIKQSKEKMDKAVAAFQGELVKLRTGRASLSILDDIKVEYYGQTVPLKQVAALATPEPRLITISAWESNVVPAIEKAIIKANIGLVPANDGKLIRLPVPSLTEERRKELVKMLKNHGESSRVTIRHARRDGLEAIKKLEKDGKITEDDSKKGSTQVQKMTDDEIARIDQMVEKKSQEIMTV